MILKSLPVRWFGAALLLYGATAAIGPMWADSSKLAIYATHAYYPSLNPGDHPGWTLLAHCWLLLTPWISPARSLHLLSALCGAAAVGLAAAAALRKTGSADAASTTALILSVALPVWWASTLTETYSMAWALTAAIALLSSRRNGFAGCLLMGLAAGLAAAVHVFALFIIVPFLTSERAARWPLIALGALTGSSPIWLAFFMKIPDPFTGHFASGTMSWSWHVASFLAPARSARGFALILALLVLAMGPLGILGLYHGSRRARRPHWIAIACLIVLAATLTTYAPFRLHLMSGMLLVGLLVLFPPVLTARLRVAHVFVQAAIYVLLPLALVASGRGSIGVRELPHRVNAWYFFSPIKVFEDGPSVYAHSLLRSAPERAVILADFNPGAVLTLVQQSEKLRSDVLIIPTAIDEILSAPGPASALTDAIDEIIERGRPAVLADGWEPYYRVSELKERKKFELMSCGPGWFVRTPPTRD